MNITPIGSRTQEAMETAAQTRAEASQGDFQAKTKLTQMAKVQALLVHAPAVDAARTVSDANEGTPSVPPPPTGAVLNVKR